MGNWVAIFFLLGSGMLRKQQRKLSLNNDFSNILFLEAVFK